MITVGDERHRHDPRRMQLAAQRDNGAAVFVDYAHKPGAVIAALQSLRPHVMGRIIAIVGAGGDRDRGKRPLMGAACARFADRCWVTDDNPRSENPAAIRAAVRAGAEQAAGPDTRVEEVGDRGAAIATAIDWARAGDVVVNCAAFTQVDLAALEAGPSAPRGITSETRVCRRRACALPLQARS